MEWFVEKFWPIPGWPEDWKDPKYQEEYKRSNGIVDIRRHNQYT